jgi:uncharacterized protein (DUF433 family)
MLNREFIERNKDIGFGEPVITGTRMTVFNAIVNAYHSENISKFLEEYGLTFAQLTSATSYCKEKRCQEIVSKADHYCKGCILRSISEGWLSLREDFDDADLVSISKDGKSFLLTNVEDAENDEFGSLGWVVAQELERKLRG